MTEASADSHPWPFPETDATALTMTPDHLATIRSLVAVWDITEAGAPGLVLRNGKTLEDHPLAPSVELFLNAAVLPDKNGQITNPWASGTMPAQDNAALLEYIPDTNLRAQLANDAKINFTADAADHALWNAAQLGQTGIDPKRPFGSGNVSQNMRALLDPHNKMSRTEFSKLKRYRFSRMILMLQLFVQRATLAPGVYWNTPQHGWQHAGQISKTPEQIGEAEWASRLETLFHRSENRYCSDLRFYVFEDTETFHLEGPYPTLAKRLKLDEIYTIEHYSPSPSYLLEKALRYLDHWPETTGDMQHSFATHVAARCYNAVGDFEKAAQVMARAHLEFPNPEIDLKSPVSQQESLWANMIITRHGLGQISDDAFVAMFDTPLSGSGTWADRVTQIYERKEPKGWENYSATYSQIKLMRAVLTETT